MRNSINSKTNRHISFNDKYNENEDQRRNTLTHIHFIHATKNEILNRYLLYFEQFLPLFINKKIENSNQLNNLRIHHKDDIELHQLRQIQILFESIEQDEKSYLNEDIILIINAFYIYIENLLKKDVFITQCKTEQQLNEHEISTIININNGDIFNMILLSFNRICHSSLNIIESSKIAEVLTTLFQNLFFNINDYCSIKLLPLLIENYHRLRLSSNSSIDNKTIPLFCDINNLRNREYFLALDILMKYIETSSTKCPYNLRLSNCGFMCDSSKQLFATIFYQLRTSTFEKSSLTNLNDCIQVFRAILKKIFNSSSLSMIKIIEDKNEYIDFMIDEENFEIIMIFFKHLYRMYKRCLNNDERNFIFDYYSTILFGELYRKRISKKMKQIFQLFILNFQQIS